MGQPGTDRFSIGVNGKKLFDSRAQEADEVALAGGVTGRVDQPGPDRLACESTAGDTGAACKGFKLGQLGARQVDSEGQSRHHCAPGKIARRTGQYAIPLRDTAQELVSRFRGCQSACKRDPFWGVIGVEKGPPFGTGMKATRQSG